MNQSDRKTGGPITWMAGNSVAANLVMLFLLIGGFFYGTQIKQEVFPEFSPDEIRISVAYPGASPDEVEEGIVLPVEEAIQSIDGIEEITSIAREGSGQVTVEAVIDTDLQRLATDIKNEVDRINAFPEEAEDPLVIVPVHKRQVVELIVYGDQGRGVLREMTEMIRDQLLQDPEITQIELNGDRPLEMSIEVSQDNLRRYNLKLSDIAAAVAGASIDLPGGVIKTRGGEILVRVSERRDYRDEFARIPVVSGTGGTEVTLGEIARIKDTFEETDQFLIYNEKPAIGLEIFRVGDQTPITVSGAVDQHLERLRHALPDGVSVDTVNDRSEIFKQRIQLLVRNGFLGLILVFVLLGIFLEARLAFWVTMGIPISFLGSLLFIPQFGVSINMVSLFAFIISLGIVVDDTIVVGENVYSYKQRGHNSLEAAVMGAREIAVPVTFSVLTNIVTFMPLYFVPGVMGKIFSNIPVVVVSVFAISLVEALFILPAHLGHQREYRSGLMYFIAGQQKKVSGGISALISKVYGPFLKFSLRFRYISVAVGLIILLITVAYVKSGRMGIIMFPKVESDFSYATLELPVGTPVEKTRDVHDRLQASADGLIDEIGREQQVKGILSFVDKNTAWIQVYMTPPGERLIPTSEFTERWRERTGNLAGVETMKFLSDFGGPGQGAALTVELQHRDTEVLKEASAELAEALEYFSIVSDIDDGFTEGKDQLDITLKPVAYQLGLDPVDIARQVRNAYYGNEVVRQLRGRNEMKIMVRYPEQERRSEYYLEEMLLATPNGAEVPLTEVVDIERGKSYNTIERRSGRRAVKVTADVTPRSKTDMILEAVKRDTLPGLMKKYVGLNYSFEGRQSDRQESMMALVQGLIIAMMIVYILLAVVFRSYIQPFIIMFSIPFGIVGAIIGHLIMGYELSILSMFGIVALSGVVVNGSLVLIDFANRRQLEGYSHFSAIINAGVQRFRPILLTTLTTFFGLMPMIFEQSRQARFLVPMAISLGFGILFSALIILILVPALYMITKDVKDVFRRIFQP